MTNGFNDAPKPSEAIHIPPAALEAGARAIGEETYISNKETQKDAARAAFVAMVEAWPGMHEWSFSDNRGTFPALILPLTEKPDDKA